MFNILKIIKSFFQELIINGKCVESVLFYYDHLLKIASEITSSSVFGFSSAFTFGSVLPNKVLAAKRSNLDVVIFDFEYAEKLVPVLHKRGQKTIFYFSGDTNEYKSNRPDIDDY
ncbi:hypothetical protein PIROE2DRAFT_11369 [Piromyces sp. E2]|nr:hypothetical protein PIROE2DRAFT_11369 [Piromyces sp. E2]|eukprot:OUM62365.1 hypothetical protein PIROE2DRAFT_11369 [Piromyces sp. E2]